jgi:hypothetical protein
MGELDLRGIERRSWRMSRQDGLLDALFGVIFLAAAVVAILDQTPVPPAARIASLCAIQFSGVGAVVWIRRRYVAPRLGYVKYSPQRRRSRITLRNMLAICVAATTALVVLTALSDRIGLHLIGDLGAWGTITAVVLVPIGAIAFFLDYPRLLIYAGLLSGVEFLHIVVGLPSRVPYAGAYAYGAASVVAFAIGIPIYVSFLRRFPRMPVGAEEVDDAA